MDMLKKAPRDNSTKKKLIILPIVIIFYVASLITGVSLALWKKNTTPINNLFSVTKTAVQLNYDGNAPESGATVTGVPASQTQTLFGGTDYEFNLSTTVPVCEGYSFVGWSDLAGYDYVSPQSGAQFFAFDADNGTLDPAAITVSQTESPNTLYAVWVKDVTVTLSYDTKGGTPAVSAQSYTLKPNENQYSFNVKSDEPQKENHDFLGWAETNGGTVTKHAGDLITLTRDNPTKTLYAVWEEVASYTYTLKFNRNIPSGTNASVPLPSAVTRSSNATTYTMSGVEVSLADSNADETGLVFLGWALGADGDVIYPAGTPISIDMAIPEGETSTETTLYAVWDFEYFIQYSRNVNDGSVGKYLRSTDALVNTDNADMIVCSTRNQTVPVRGTYDGSEYLYRRSNYMLVGFSTTATGTSAAQTITIAAPGKNHAQTVYAIWTPGSFALIYDANGGSNPPASEVITEAALSHVFTVSSGVPTKPAGSNATFLGWAETPDATSAAYQAGAQITLTESNPTKTLYAVWEYTYTLTFDKGYGNADTSVPATLTYSTTEKEHVFSIPAGPIPERTDWSFLFWTENEERQSNEKRYYGTGTQGVRTKITATYNNPNLTLYAHYNPDDGYKLVLNANGGSGGTTELVNRTTEYRPVYELRASNPNKVTPPTRTNCTFLGWAETSTATQPQYVLGDFVYGEGDVQTKTLYAVWRHWNAYVVKVDYNGGKGSTGCSTVSSFTTDVKYADTDGVYTYETVGGETSSFALPKKDNQELGGFGYSKTSVKYSFSYGPLLKRVTVKNVKIDKNDSSQTIAVSNESGYKKYTLTIYAVWTDKPVKNQYQLVLNKNASDLTSSATKEHTYSVLATSDDDGQHTFSKPEYSSLLDSRTGYRLKGFAYSSSATQPTLRFPGESS